MPDAASCMLVSYCNFWVEILMFSLGLMVCIKISKYLHIKDLFPTPQPIFDAVPRPLPQSIKAVIKSIVLLYDMDSMEVDK